MMTEQGVPAAQAQAQAQARALRIRYAVAGVVLAALWIGHQGEPEWEHALRTLLVLIAISPLMNLTRRYRARRAGPESHPSSALMWLIAVRLVFVGVALGVSWLVGRLLVPHHADSVRSLVLRLLLLAATVPLQLRIERQRRARGPARTAASRLSLSRIRVAKVGLVLVALGAEWLLQLWTQRADLIVAAGLLVTVALLGPRIHRHLASASAGPSRRGRRTPGPREDPASDPVSQGTGTGAAPA